MSESAIDPQTLIGHAKTYLPPEEIQIIENAYSFALKAHTGQFRKSGEPYIIHPLRAAETLAEYRMDTETLVAALLHDVPEDTAVSLQTVREHFGKDVASLVDGVTKLSKVRLKKNWQSSVKTDNSDRTNENFITYDRHVATLRKMFLAMSRDLRVILIKLADRLHNMETLDALPAEKQQRIAQETLGVYAPLANRLGMGQLKGRLEDLSFTYAFPKESTWVNQVVSDEFKKRQRYIERVRRVLLKRLVAVGIQAEVHGRAKYIYSLWKKLSKHDRDLAKIYDLVAARVIVPTVEDCYRVLGLIHTMWKPLPGRIKDYIATPKPNGYQSLHTTVFALGGRITEIQIRTPEMHHWAEYGIAAHWAYKEGTRTVAPDGRLAWIKELARLQQTLRDPNEWKKGLSLDFFEDRIFVFTPNGDVLDLPAKATPVDFAFAIHSDLGKRCVGAKVNGKLVPLSHALDNGDIVEILLNKKANATADWLQYVKTNKARSQIKRTLSGGNDTV